MTARILNGLANPRGAAAALLVLLAFLLGNSPASQAEAEAKPILVKVHADWCGSCVRLQPVWDEIEARLGERATTVVFDVTNKGSMQASRRKAEALGIEDVFNEYGERTGTILVLAANTHEVVNTFKGEYEFAPYEEAVTAATP